MRLELDADWQSDNVVAFDEFVCWTRMQAESGQALEEIVARKDLERRASDGIFFWGVGNSPARISRSLAQMSAEVPALFSIMKSKPKAIDSAPARVWLWRRYIDLNGRERDLPPAVLISSRGSPNGLAKRSHAALMCHSDDTLRISQGPEFDPSAYRNAGGTGAPVGASQVTSLLRRIKDEQEGSGYRVNMRARLTGSFWVRLIDPVELSFEQRQVLSRAENWIEDDWRCFVLDCKTQESIVETGQGSLLL